MSVDLLLQIWGGGFYLANKILFALGENMAGVSRRRYTLSGWLVYLLGVPAWVVLLVDKGDWIAASIEAGGVPAMLLGLYTVWSANQTPNRLFARVVSYFTYACIALGLGYSLIDNGGLVSLTQLLEIGVMIGFLMGSYLLARGVAFGWLFFMLMNVSMGLLMLHQDKPLLAVQQMVSLCFVLYGFAGAVRARRVGGSPRSGDKGPNFPGGR